jgi:electron transfer flavoprotein alpha subunit
MYPCLEAIRPSYGESKLATIVGFWCPQMATARPGAFSALPKDLSRHGVIEDFVPTFEPGDFAVEILETVRAEAGGESLFSAEIIVTGGRPCGELDEFRLVRELVDELKRRGVAAEWGASRQAVDAGYAPHERQIGQTGKTVRPKIYVAVAISGAVQHLAGMKESGKVIAINKDPGAGMFRSSDIGLVGDYRDVLPVLIDRVRSGFAFGLPATTASPVLAAEARR